MPSEHGAILREWRGGRPDPEGTVRTTRGDEGPGWGPGNRTDSVGARAARGRIVIDLGFQGAEECGEAVAGDRFAEGSWGHGV